MAESLPGESAGTVRVIVLVVVVDDHEVYRAQVRAYLEAEPDFEVVAEAGDGRAAVRLAGELEPDAVVMDVTMPHLNGIEATRLITESLPTIKVLGLSLHRERRFVEGMLTAGASGYVLKENAVRELAAALREQNGTPTSLVGIPAPLVLTSNRAPRSALRIEDLAAQSRH